MCIRDSSASVAESGKEQRSRAQGGQLRSLLEGRGRGLQRGQGQEAQEGAGGLAQPQPRGHA
eukprot:10163809-Alexandrium_andersonii.AAC.1